MSPSAITPDHDNGTAHHNNVSVVQGHTNGSSVDGHQSLPDSQFKHILERTDSDDIQDLICVGFGPASLAIAIALHDALESGQHHGQAPPKVRFLERQSSFAWHAGMLLPGTKMQITFIKDMATLRNPRSNFTFLNYLHQKGRLASFTNLGTFLPQRLEYEDYLRWCANHFNDLVDYGQDVDRVEVGETNRKTGAIENFVVKSKDRATGKTLHRRAKNVVIAVGGTPHIPMCLRTSNPRVIHSSQYATQASSLFTPGSQPKRIAVIGAGQSAAEVFHNIPHRFPGCQAYLLIKGAALRPSDDSPFVNEIFDPDRVNDIYSQDSQLRAEAIMLDKSTNYGVVRLELLEELYSAMYSYGIRYKSQEDWPQQILTHRTVTGLSEGNGLDDASIRLHIQNKSGSFFANKQTGEETLNVDMVVVASGYRRSAHEDMLESMQNLRPGSYEGKWEVSRDYKVQFRDGQVRPDAGIWLQGCNETTHGLSDTLLSILAVRGGEMVESIFGPGAARKTANGSVTASSGN